MNFNAVDIVLWLATRESTTIENHLMSLLREGRIDLSQAKIRPTRPGVLCVAPVKYEYFQRFPICRSEQYPGLPPL